MGGDVSELVVLAFVRKQAEQAIWNKPVSTFFLVVSTSSCFDFLPWLPLMVDYNL